MWSVHPDVCHGLDEDDSIRDGNAFAAGEFVEIDIYGSASHNGGHCAFWWTTDESSDWYKIIDVKDCTITDTFYVMMPYTMDTACETKCTFAFTWVPTSSGACEIYMNCAEVSVSGVTGASSDAITIDFQSMIDGGDPCVRVDDTTHWTTIFGDIKDGYTDEDANGGATTVDDATTDDIITVDETDITESIEDATDALCLSDDAVNVDGSIMDDGTCGNQCEDSDNCRCDDGQCCSEHGYCGPEIGGYDDDDNPYYVYYENGIATRWNSSSEAIAAYCDNNQGDWRLYSCEDTSEGSGGDVSTTMIDDSDISTTLSDGENDVTTTSDDGETGGDDSGGSELGGLVTSAVVAIGSCLWNIV